MPPIIATIVYVIGILGLFALDRDPSARTSKALWIPFIWLLLGGSRTVGVWLRMGQLATTAAYEEGSPVDRVIFASLVVLGVVVLIGRTPQVGRLLQSNIPILLFFLYCGVSILWSDYPDVTLKRWIKGIGDPLMSLIVLTDPDPVLAVKRLLKRLTFILIPWSILLIKYYPQWGRAFESFHGDRMSYTGVTTHKNSLGMLCLLFGLASLWRFLEEYSNKQGDRRKHRLIAHGTILLMVFWLLWMANSMTSTSCFLMGAGLIVATRRQAIIRKPALVHLIILAILSVSIFALFWDSGGALVGTLGRDASLSGRTDVWRLVLSMAGNPILGTGYESFWLGTRLTKMWIYWWHPNEAHNAYLEVYLTLGWIGAVLLALLIVTGYRNVFAGFRRDPDTGRLWLAYFVIALAYDLTESAIRMLCPIWIIFLMAIMAVSSAPKPIPLPAYIDDEDSFAEYEPEIGRAVSAPLRQEFLKPFDASGSFRPNTQGGLRRLALKGVASTLFSSGSGLVIQTVCTMILARLLTPKDFGVVTMVTTFSLLLVNCGFNGFTEVLLQWPNLNHALASNLFWINLGISLVLTGGFAAAGSLLARFYHEPLVAPITIGVSLTIFLSSLWVVHLALLKRAMRFSAVSVNDIVARAVSVAVSILLAWAGWGFWALVAGVIALPISMSIGAWLLCSWVPGRPRRAAGTGSMVRFATHVYGRFTANYFARNLDNLLVGWRFNAQALGFYKKAYDLFYLAANQLVSPLTDVAVSALSRLDRNSVQYRRYLLNAMAVVAFVGMGVGANLTLVGSDVIRVLLGPKWEPAGRIFTFFGAGIGMRLLHSTHGWIHLSIGRADRWLRWEIMEFVFTGLLFLVALPWGPAGIAVAWSVSFWITTIPCFWYAGRPIQFGVAPVVGAVWKFAVASLLAGGASALIVRQLPFVVTAAGSLGALMRIVIVSGLFVSLYLGAVILLYQGCSPLYQVGRLVREMVPWHRFSKPSPAFAVTRSGTGESA